MNNSVDFEKFGRQKKKGDKEISSDISVRDEAVFVKNKNIFFFQL